MVTAPLFAALKLDASLSRGSSDILLSKDLEDLIAVLDGRPALTAFPGPPNQQPQRNIIPQTNSSKAQQFLVEPIPIVFQL